MADEHVFELSGGRLCLDFANTVDDRPRDRPSDHLGAYRDLVAWARQAGIVDGDGAGRLLDLADRRPSAATDTLRRAVALRENLYRIFSAVAAGGSPSAGDLATLNRALAEALGRARLVPADTGFRWGWEGGPEALGGVLWPVARSAAELLTSDDLFRVRECAADDCGWLFLDASKNRSRRWCDMSVCGNRAKARRHYARRRAAERR